MARLLVSDTSVLIDLERGNLLQMTFKLPVPLAVPDVLYERELRANNGELLRTLGLQVLSLSDVEVSLAQEYFGWARSLSIPDAFALALAKSGGHVLVWRTALSRSSPTRRPSNVMVFSGFSIKSLKRAC